MEKISRRQFLAITSAYAGSGIFAVRLLQAGVISLVVSAEVGCGGGGAGSDILQFVRIPVDGDGTVFEASRRNGYWANGDQHDNGEFVTTITYNGKTVDPGIGLTYEVNDQPLFGQGPNGADAADHDTVTNGDVITWMQSPTTPMLQKDLALVPFSAAFEGQFHQPFNAYASNRHRR
ncbi:MAG TPA: hypothetical protein VLE93_00835 [Candidatus Saccharimonadales bacterium]|nr:hypothetical protein [Candidatus Saccharimonadales bacterium]